MTIALTYDRGPPIATSRRARIIVESLGNRGLVPTVSKVPSVRTYHWRLPALYSTPLVSRTASPILLSDGRQAPSTFRHDHDLVKSQRSCLVPCFQFVEDYHASVH